MILIHKIDTVKNKVIDMYFIDEDTGERIEYTVTEFVESIRNIKE